MRYFQVSEDDLAELERTLPDLMSSTVMSLTNRQRVQFRRCQRILTNVRWNYGPPEVIEEVDLGPNQGDQ